jgi:hypothetical protein
MIAIDLVGKRFGKWTVLRRNGSRKQQNGTVALWECRCNCGVERTVTSTNLRRGTSESCGKTGCRKIKHGMSFTSEYRTWAHMIARCYLSTVEQYPNYGGRGIRVCDRWRGKHGFENFFADMGPRPSSLHSLDRFPDHDGNYEKSNCRWATRSQQSKNRRRFVALNNYSDNQILQEFVRRNLKIQISEVTA